MSVVIKSYIEPPFNEKEVLRYAGCKELDEQTQALLFACWKEAKEKLSYKVCYMESDVEFLENGCKIEGFLFPSKRLKEMLLGSKKVILFCATVGVEIDRLIGKYARLSPSKAVFLQAIGAERVEALCNCFCKDIKEGEATTRFSPGYGDLPLETQKALLQMLQAEKKVGVCLNDSLLMSPSKSVTAIMGVPCTR